MPCPLRMYAIMALQNIPSFVSLSKICLFTRNDCFVTFLYYTDNILVSYKIYWGNTISNNLAFEVSYKRGTSEIEEPPTSSMCWTSSMLISIDSLIHYRKAWLHLGSLQVLFWQRTMSDWLSSLPPQQWTDQYRE